MGPPRRGPTVYSSQVVTETRAGSPKGSNCVGFWQNLTLILFSLLFFFFVLYFHVFFFLLFLLFSFFLSFPSLLCLFRFPFIFRYLFVSLFLLFFFFLSSRPKGLIGRVAIITLSLVQYRYTLSILFLQEARP